jgi:uncharacterized protein (DUF1800 family)
MMYLASLHGFLPKPPEQPREIPEENIHPDENYAREIMQLFHCCPV